MEDPQASSFRWRDAKNRIEYQISCGILKAYIKNISERCAHDTRSRREWLMDKLAFAARRSGRADHYKIWRDDNHAIDLSGLDVREKFAYTHDNPVRAGIVERAEDYLMSNARDYSGEPGLDCLKSYAIAVLASSSLQTRMITGTA
ncbi:hypothetical protein WG906_13990 [Pedobacter sp. P351]|uniref:hypothetical protein n=1 Tax=Pedobacter superstes TaxID=3133441 RepID=UPI0030A0BF52